MIWIYQSKIGNIGLKDFSCSDCGKDFYFQKNLFTHVVEKHGKSVDELPNLSLVKTEDGIIKWVIIQE